MRVIPGAMYVVAIETGNAATIHHALNEIVALHAVLVCGAVREIKKILRFSKSVVFQLPIVRELQSHVIANGPIVILAPDWIREWLSLRVTLDASIARRDVVHVCRVEGVAASGMCYVVAARAVAAFAAHIPFRYLLGVNIVANRMTAVA